MTRLRLFYFTTKKMKPLRQLHVQTKIFQQSTRPLYRSLLNGTAIATLDCVAVTVLALIFTPTLCSEISESTCNRALVRELTLYLLAHVMCRPDLAKI
jgi:hypothetical protein